MKSFYKKYLSKKEMLTDLLSLTNRFQVEETLELCEKSGYGTFYLVTTWGKKQKTLACYNFKQLAAVLAIKGEVPIQYPLCYNNGNIYHVFSTNLHFATPEQKEEYELERAKKEEENKEPVVPDWNYVSSLENTKENKKVLDKYAAKFGISLKANKSLANMIRDFKAAHASQEA